MVYLLHFDKPISPFHPCQHYVGSTDDLDGRLVQHQRGVGARLPAVAAERNIGFQVARVWEGGREEERKLKAMKNSPRYCPLCREKPVSPRGLKNVQ